MAGNLLLPAYCHICGRWEGDKGVSDRQKSYQKWNKKARPKKIRIRRYFYQAPHLSTFPSKELQKMLLNSLGLENRTCCLLFEEDWKEVLCCSHGRLIRVGYQHILVNLKEINSLEMYCTTHITYWLGFCGTKLLFFYPYLVTFFKHVPIIRKMYNTLDQLQHQSSHHLYVQGLSFLIWAIQPKRSE